MNFLAKIITAFFILGIIFFIVLLAIIGFTGIEAKEESMQSVYSYDLYMTTSKPLYNTTILIPVPCGYDNASGGWISFLDLSKSTIRHLDTDNISIQIESKDEFKYLNISGKTILPVYKNHIEPIPIYPGQNESELPPTPTTVYSHSYSPKTPESVSMELHEYVIKKDDEIDTKNPFDREQLMRPYTILNTTGRDDGFYRKDSFKGRIDDSFSESEIKVPLYLFYETEPDNVLTISCSLRSANEWWNLGWSGNSYDQQVSNSFEGASNGTYFLEGLLISGEGAY